MSNTVTDLMTSIGNGSDDEIELQAKANRALEGKHKSSNVNIKNDEVVEASKFLEEPELDVITKDEVAKLYPLRVNNAVLEKVTEVINGATEGMDYVLAKEFRSNLFGYIDVLKEGSKYKASFEDYANACKFITFKMAGNTDVRAYALTFPDRVRRLERDKLPNSHLYHYANVYAKGKLVIELMTRVMIPTHVLYQDIFHKAVKAQAELMMNAKSEKVRADAANSLMTHLKTPEIKKAELQVNVGSSGAIDQLSEALNNLSGKQSEMLSQGKYSLQDIREATIIEVVDED